MGESIWVNSEVRRTFLKIAIAAVTASVIAVFYFSSLFLGFNKALIDKNLAVIGSLVQQHPELKDDIVMALISEPSKEEVTKGIAAAKEYGYTSDLPVSYSPLVNALERNTVTSILVLLFLCFMAAALIDHGVMRRFLGRVRQAAGAAEKIIDGDFNIKLDEHDEGDLSKLGHQFNQMANRLELSIERLKKEKTFLRNIVSDISHQLKTPLSSIKVFNEILFSGKAADENDRHRFLIKTGEQIERMEWLIQKLLLLARLESGAIEFTDEDKPLYPTVEAAVESLRDKWEAKGIDVRIMNTGEEIRILHDEGWLEEAISNIVKNSIEHTGEGGRIDIELGSTPLMATVEIRDNGEGIGSEDLPHIFERFYKGRNKAGGSGTGIGLALAKGIIENEGGLIKAGSTPGKGATFTITFLREKV